MEHSESKLVAACQQGDRCAQQQLFDDTHARIYRLMVRMVGQQDAEDVTQQVYLQVFRKIDQFSGRSKLSTWTYRLAVNEALQHLRRRKRNTTHSLAYEPVDRAARHESKSELADALEAAMADLDPELRTAFVLREMDELPYNAIADVLDIPEGTVCSRLNRARRELQKRLSQDGWGP
ncbi:sigma-70 family RNA polymerase sigma factor [Pirellulales bacterium]|nr:sigma-70 family RNA polymerase sigma factor [Pirellulales bacterium]